ncbi:hypothetical protein [Chroococcidiopsis thermalis]|uniref:CobQ/CobB/MinD/ParA nucleotide binding domain-containing protein n=1 Tax=Chroococcidiopsis thermalis (strain PCC 7203) TaxID=251229 RepID=K9U960_CHRTP|nr:hypothetical protein [Chroococcidiopsis thermalis]AFY91153.1 hypothetical protein Chro_5814 [Chroococcidiopsis thermalis PCC 7203]
MLRKRLLVTAGDARVGKSTVARLLLDLLLEKQISVRAYYNGNRNKLAPYQKIENLGVEELQLSRGGADNLLIDLESLPDLAVVVTDLPGQHLSAFKFFVEEFLLFDTLASLGYRMTAIHPISHRRDCVEYLQELSNFCGDNVDYIVIKNNHFDTHFPYYDVSKTRSSIEALGAVEVNLANLSLFVYQQCEDCGIPYSQVISDLKVNTFYRHLLFNWMESFYRQFALDPKASNYLGLNWQNYSSTASETSF